MPPIKVSSTTIAIQKQPRSLSNTLIMVSDTEFDYVVKVIGAEVSYTCPDLSEGNGIIFNPKHATKYTLRGETFYFVECTAVYAWYNTVNYESRSPSTDS